MAVVERSERAWGRVVVAFVSLALFVASLVVLNLVLRSVMEIGGSCASGGPYVVAKPCPKGIGWLAPVSIWVGLASAAVYTLAVWRLPGPKWTSFMWPALFISLGWQFIVAGREGGASTDDAVGGVVVGVVFILMGAVPLLFVLRSAELRQWTFWGDPTDDDRDRSRSAPRARLERAITGPAVFGVPPSRSPGPRPSTPRADVATGAPKRGGAQRVVDGLEQLAELRRSGDLTPQEYERLKAHLLSELEDA